MASPKCCAVALLSALSLHVVTSQYSSSSYSFQQSVQSSILPFENRQSSGNSSLLQVKHDSQAIYLYKGGVAIMIYGKLAFYRLKFYFISNIA